MTEATTPKRKPGNSAFKQQRLSACQPIITPKTVFPVFIAIATIFSPLGGILFYFNDKALELSIDYTHCDTEALFEFGPIPVKYVTDSMIKSKSIPENSQHPKWKRSNITILPNNKTITRCSIIFYIHKEMKPPVYLYYRLTNFFQNERGYARSLDTDQLKGKAVNRDGLKRGGCKSLALYNETIIYPCGLLANSMFNDTIGNLTLLNALDESLYTNITYNFTYNGIAPPGETAKYKPTTYNIGQIRPPLNWEARYPNGTYTTDYPPIDPSTDEHFQVWMHTAGLPIFRKTYGINEAAPLQVGYYQININTVFPVKGYGGTKSIVISTPSVVGGKHPFPGIAYIVVGVVCGIIGIILAVESFFNSHKRRDRRYASMQIGNSQKNIDSQ
ncbi:17099_t:CDS:2 [Dentiscutata heterogama]|uniref:17099_t:CDS:1 n=1 Tax=Dentiscutata heterogama TaxID=1316150 RepID=A0ACA9JXR1_9GLOM|nr:17099_t:CDS:2 [Dentiscutata heterogama]